MTWLKNLWAKEPVLVTGLLPLLVALGVITTGDADAAKTTIEAVATAVTVITAAFAARSQVSPASKYDAKHD